MAVCVEYRIPHTQFLEWDQVDRDKAIWWQIRQSEVCTNCGTREADWDPGRGGNRNAFKPEIRRCRGCEVKGQLEDTDEAKQGRGLYIVMRRREQSSG